MYTLPTHIYNVNLEEGGWEVVDINLFHMYGCLASMYDLQHLCARCLQRSEEVTGSPRTGGTESMRHHVGAGT